MARRRKVYRLRPELAARILTEQNARCLYCGLPLVAAVRKGNGVVVTHLEWDHYIPYSYLEAHPEDNFVAACSLCNNIKHDSIFDTLEQARNHVIARRKQKKIEPASSEDEHLLTEDDELWQWNTLLHTSTG